MRFDESFHDCQTETQTGSALSGRAVFGFIKNSGELIFGDTDAAVANPAFDRGLGDGLPRADPHFSVVSVFDGVADEILKHAPDKAGIGADNQITRHLIDQSRIVRLRQRPQIKNKPFDQRPEIELATLKLEPGIGPDVCVFLDDFLNQRLQLLHVAAQRFERSGRFLCSFPILKCDLQNACGYGYRIQRRAQVVSDKREVFVPTFLHFAGLLVGKTLHGEANGPVQHAVDDME